MKRYFSLLRLIINQILNNKVLAKIDEIWTNALDFLEQAWWIEVLTTQPRCTYYFGPFRGAELAHHRIDENISKKDLNTIIEMDREFMSITDKTF